jgi:hypothetical protein
MNPIEDQIKAATRAEASTLREVGPLRLPPAPAAVPRHRLAPRAPRWPGWAAPVAAAAVVIAVALSLVIVKSQSNGPTVPPSTPGSASSVVPPYYVTLSPQTGAPHYRFQPLNDLVVGDALTGQQLASLTPPAGTTFFGVTGGADDRTFVVDTVPLSSMPTPLNSTRTWYLLRIAPGTSSPPRLTRLPVPPLAGVTAIALSGSGQELAVTMGGGSENADITGFLSNTADLSNGVLPSQPYFPPTVPWVLSLYSVTTGRLLRAWSSSSPSVTGGGPGLYSDNNTRLTWVDGDRRIAFFTLWITKKPNAKSPQDLDHEGVRELDVTADGSDLLADSQVAWSQTQPASSIDHSAACLWEADVLVAADGKTVVCPSAYVLTGKYRKGDHWTVRWLAYSTTAPTVARTLDTVTIAETVPSTLLIDPEEVSPSGSTVIAAWYLLTAGALSVSMMPVDMISKGSSTPLPVKLAIIPADSDPIIAW